MKELLPNIYYGTIPAETASQNDVNIYMIHDHSQTLFIDSGYDTRSSLHFFQEVFSQFHIRPEKTILFLTHYHIDHTGMAWWFDQQGIDIYMHEKEYVVTVNRPITDAFVKKMSGGVKILDTVTRPCQVTKISDYEFRIILTQGLNRQIRRMCEACGYRVRALKRVRIMNIELGSLKEGTWRDVTEQEWKELQKLIAHSSNTTVKLRETQSKMRK